MKMKLMLLLFQTIAVQNCVIEWVRDHRVHHKFSDTNADPHNASRGFFFSHMGWLMCKKHPDVRKYGARVDMSDLEAEPILKFQEKYDVPHR
jgi:stearoyl-CoA desaturase (Delta-9 desaturase)